MAGGGGAEDGAQRAFAEIGELSDSGDVVFVQGTGGDFADAPESFDRQRMQEFEFAVGWHETQAVGFGDGAGDLGQEFGAGDADRDGQPDLVAHPGA
ncbi:hypothetical protein NONI108955_44135 [Nocardia ninae]